VKKPHRSLTDKSLSGDAQSGDKADMPPSAPPRITPLQVLALLIIWTVAILGLVKPASGDTRAVAVKAPQNVACAKAS
jgi:hypothetical protein